MTIPSLPSDSLYKFVSFFGISLTLICLYFLFTEGDNISRKIVELNVKSREIRMQDSVLWKDAKSIQEEAEYISQRFDISNPFSATDTSYSWTMIYKGAKEKEILSDTIKRLVERFKTKQSLLVQKRIERDVNEYLIDQLTEDYDNKMILFGILSLVGTIICIFGFELWYNRIQLPNDKKIKRELLILPPIADHCQSCYSSFEYYGTKRGSEENGTASHFFCNKCYENGQFIQPQMTLAEMKEQLTNELESIGYKELEINEVISRLKRLQRWNRKARF